MAELSLPAELMLLSIDPGRGGLAVSSRRLRKALAVADGVERGRGRPARRPRPVRRQALTELITAGLVEREGFLGRRLRLTDLKAAADRYHDVQRGVREGRFERERDAELLVLLAWTGSLSARMSRDERRLVARRLKTLQPGALAAVAAAASMDLFSEARTAAVDLGGGKSGGPSEIEAFLGSGH